MADKKISDFTAASTLADADLFEIETSGGNSRQMTAANVKTFMGGWTLFTSSPSGVANADFTGLAGYNDFLIIARGLTQSASGVLSLRASVDNGSSYYATSGDYVLASAAGAESNVASFGSFHGTNATAARSGAIQILGASLSGAPKVANSFTAGQTIMLIASTSPITALRVYSTGGGNLGAGTIYLYAR